MQFNVDKSKQAIQVIFSHRKSKPIHPSLIFNGSEIVTIDGHKHSGFFFIQAILPWTQKGNNHQGTQSNRNYSIYVQKCIT